MAKPSRANCGIETTEFVMSVVVRIVADSLGLETVPDPDVALDRLGGGKAEAASIVEGIWDVLSVEVPMKSLFPYGSPREISRIVLADPISAQGPLVHAAGPTTGRPIFIVHAGDGGVAWFLKHFRRADVRRPVIGLAATEPIAPTIEQTASEYVARIQKRQPGGPYTIGGYCIGCTIALEMARQLDEAGEEVEPLLAFDPGDPSLRLDVEEVAAFRFNQILRRRHPVMYPFYAVARARTLNDVCVRLRLQEPFVDEVERRFYTGIYTIWSIMAAASAYVDRPTRVGVNLYVSRDATDGEGLRPYISRFIEQVQGPRTVVAIDAPHIGIFESDDLLSALGPILRAAE